MKRFELVGGGVLALLFVLALTGVLGNLLNVVGVSADNVQFADAVIGLVTLIGIALAAIVSIREANRRAETVRVVLVGGGRRHDAGRVRREHISRAEIQGILGTVPMATKGARYALSAVTSDGFQDGWNRVLDGTERELLVPVQESEWGQFAITPTQA